MSVLTYRPELDGLRAAAVLLVLFFHAGIGVSGGFVGVDVFFVLSGFLITSIILRQVESGTFRLRVFWARRLRRLFPAMLVLVASCLVAAWFVLFPRDFSAVADTAVSHVILASNLYLWRSTGYFSSAAESNMLLHLWSLAVEEQFYLLYPPLLVALRRAAPMLLLPILVVATLGSLAASVLGTEAHPVASFYLLPTRAWELLVGALLAAGAVPIRAPRCMREITSWAGLAAIMYAGFAYDDTTPFPGLAALVPCGGTACLIWANSYSRTVVGRMLALRPVVFVGLISYSLYLWHWPIMVGVKYWVNGPLPMPMRLGLVGLSLLLATASWRWIETPFRVRRVAGTSGSLIRISVFASLGCVLVGVLIHGFSGFPSRFPAKAISFLGAAQEAPVAQNVDLNDAAAGRLPDVGQPATGPAQCLVWGDSHAMAIVPALAAISRAGGGRVVVATHSSTAPLLGFESSGRWALGAESGAFAEAVVLYVRKHQVKNVLLAAFWSGGYGFHTERGLLRLKDHLLETVTSLQAAGATVWVMGQVPVQEGDVPRALARAVVLDHAPERVGVSLRSHRARTSEIAATLSAATSLGAIVLDPAAYLVDENGICRAEYGGTSMYRDANHLSSAGAAMLIPMLRPLFQD